MRSALAERLGEYLVKSGKITEKQLTSALERQVIMGGRLGTNLIELGFLTEDELLQFLSKKLKIPPVQPDDLENIEPALTQLISRETAEKYSVVPIKLVRKTLSVALMDPLDLKAVDELRFITGYAIKPFIASEARVRYVLQRYYQIDRELRYISILDEERKKHEEEDTHPSLKREPAPEELEAALKQAKEDWAEVRDRDEAGVTLLKTANLILDRGILFHLQSGTVSGWKGFPSYREPEIAKLQFKLEDLPLFKEIAEKKSGYQGPPPDSPVYRELVQAIGGPPSGDIMAAPILINDAVVAILYGDNPVSGFSARSREFMQKLLHKFAMALGILILRKKILEI
jgi:hypothetical protein